MKSKFSTHLQLFKPVPCMQYYLVILHCQTRIQFSQQNKSLRLAIQISGLTKKDENANRKNAAAVTDLKSDRGREFIHDGGRQQRSFSVVSSHNINIDVLRNDIKFFLVYLSQNIIYIIESLLADCYQDKVGTNLRVVNNMFFQMREHLFEGTLMQKFCTSDYLRRYCQNGKPVLMKSINGYC